MSVKVEILKGSHFTATLSQLAELRITIFREWPYLYDGDLDYEARYLERFAQAKDAFLAVAIDDETIVGATTAAPLAGEAEEFRAPFEQAGMELDTIFYFAESLLLPQYRGQGIGHKFFDLREAHARKAGTYTHASFCSVVRPIDHPARPAEYLPLDGFWTRRGYRPIDGLTTQFSWKDVGGTVETAKPMQFWMKEL